MISVLLYCHDLLLIFIIKHDCIFGISITKKMQAQLITCKIMVAK